MQGIVQNHIWLIWTFRLLQGMLKTPARAQEGGSCPPLFSKEPEHVGPQSLPTPQPLRPALSQRPSPQGMPHSSRRAPCSSPAPKNRAGDSAQPALTHAGLMTMPRGPCPARPTSASHLQQQTREQLQLFPLQDPTLSLPARLETRAHEQDQEKQFSFGVAELSRARSRGLCWPSPAEAAARPSPPSCLLLHPGWSPSLQYPPSIPPKATLDEGPHPPPPRSYVTPRLARATDHLRAGAQHPKRDPAGVKRCGPGILADPWLQAGHARGSSTVAISMTNIIIIISHNSRARAKPAGNKACSQPVMPMHSSMFSAGPRGCKEKDCHGSPSFLPSVSMLHPPVDRGGFVHPLG